MDMMREMKDLKLNMFLSVNLNFAFFLWNQYFCSATEDTESTKIMAFFSVSSELSVAIIFNTNTTGSKPVTINLINHFKNM